MTQYHRNNWLGLIIAIPAMAVLGIEGGKFVINLFAICSLPFLLRSLIRMVKRDLFPSKI